MKAVILIGGQGTRLRPLTCTVPKAMVPILNQPFLEHLLLYLKKHGIGEAILAMGYLPDAIQRGLGDGSRLGIRITYSVESSPLGTAGAVKYAEPHLDREAFLVFNGDIITDIDLSEMIDRHRRLRPGVSIALMPVDNPSAYGVVETDTTGLVKRFVEKPKAGQSTSNMVNAGIYILEPEILDMIPPASPFMFEHHVFPQLLQRGGSMQAYPSDAYWIDIGTAENYLKVHHDLLRQQGRIIRGDGVVIDPSAQIQGPALIGPACRIGARARLTGPVVLGPGCEVAEGAIVEGAVLWDGVRAGPGAVLRDCLVGSGSTLESGSEVTERCVLGDGVTILPGTHLPPGTGVWPGLRIGNADLPLRPPQ